MSAPLRVALVGSRGIPARYGGYETLMDELAPRLVARGFEVTVYCRSHSTAGAASAHRGARLVDLPDAAHQAPRHAGPHPALLPARRRASASTPRWWSTRANALFVPLLAAAGMPDGAARRRHREAARQVGPLRPRRSTRSPSGSPAVLPDALVTDAEVIRRHYLERYGAESTPIAYGVEPRPLAATGLLRRLGLEPRGYFLYVSRFEPENNPHRVAEAYRAVGGDDAAGDGRRRALRRPRSSRLHAAAPIRASVFPGPIYGDGYRELLSHALAYVHATEVGGTHPALVEAMGYGNCVVVHDTPENREVGGRGGALVPRRRAREPGRGPRAGARPTRGGAELRPRGGRAGARALRLGEDRRPVRRPPRAARRARRRTGVRPGCAAVAVRLESATAPEADAERAGTPRSGLVFALDLASGRGRLPRATRALRGSCLDASASAPTGRALPARALPAAAAGGAGDLGRCSWARAATARTARCRCSTRRARSSACRLLGAVALHPRALGLPARRAAARRRPDQPLLDRALRASSRPAPARREAGPAPDLALRPQPRPQLPHRADRRHRATAARDRRVDRDPPLLGLPGPRLRRARRPGRSELDAARDPRARRARRPAAHPRATRRRRRHLRRHAARARPPRGLFLALQEQGIRVRFALDFFPHATAQVDLEELDGMPLLTFSTSPERPGRARRQARPRRRALGAAPAARAAGGPASSRCAIKLRAAARSSSARRRCGLNGRSSRSTSSAPWWRTPRSGAASCCT